MELKFRPRPASSIGLISNYQCTFECSHCLYCSSPRVKESVDQAALFSLIDQIDAVLGPVPLHVGGGEPLIDLERVKGLVSKILTTRIELEYVETNGAPLARNTREKLEELKAAGLGRLLLSISPFHNEFMALRETEGVFQRIVSVLGADGIFPWHTGYLAYLGRVSSSRPVSLEDHFRACSPDEIMHQLTSIMYIHPGGRAARMLAQHMPLFQPDELFRTECRERLASPVHAHIDHQGNYLAGFCSGLRVGAGSAWSLERLYNEGISLSHYPLLEMLIQEDLRKLFDYGVARGYKPREEGYVSSCDLCLDVRIHLYGTGERYQELYPRFFYEELALQAERNHEESREG